MQLCQNILTCLLLAVIVTHKNNNQLLVLAGVLNATNAYRVNEFSQLFSSNDYFANMNPRLMRRIVNSIALTGRLLRSFEVDFSWFLLYLWVSERVSRQTKKTSTNCCKLWSLSKQTDLKTS